MLDCIMSQTDGRTFKHPFAKDLKLMVLLFFFYVVVNNVIFMSTRVTFTQYIFV